MLLSLKSQILHRKTVFSWISPVKSCKSNNFSQNSSTMLYYRIFWPRLLIIVEIYNWWSWSENAIIQHTRGVLRFNCRNSRKNRVCRWKTCDLNERYMFLVRACKVKRMLSNETWFDRIRWVFEVLTTELYKILFPGDFHFLKKQWFSAKTSSFHMQLIIGQKIR